MTDDKRRVLAFLFENAKQHNNVYASINSVALKLKLKDELSSEAIDLILEDCYSEGEINANAYEDVALWNNRDIRLTDYAISTYGLEFIYNQTE